MSEQLAVSDVPGGSEGTTDLLRRGFHGSVAVMVSRAAAGAAGFVFSIYTLRYLSMPDYAVLKVLRSFVVLGTVATSLGLSASLLRFVPELLAKRANAALRRLLAIAAVLKVLAVAALAVFLVAAYGPLERALDLPEAMGPLLSLIVVYLAAVILSDFVAQGILASFLDQTFSSIVSAVMVAGYTAATVWCLERGYGLEGVLWSQVVFLVLALAAFAARAALRCLPVARGEAGTAMHIRSRLIRFSGFSVLVALGANLRSAAVDVLVISSFLGDAEVAIYGFASGLALMAFGYTPMANIGTILTPLVSREYARTENREKLVFFFQLATKLIAHTSLPMLVGLFVFLPNVITDIYGRPDYLPGLGVAQLFVGYMVVRLFTRPFAVLYSVLERLDLSLYALILFGLNLVLLLTLVPRFGMMGAAWSTCGTAPLYFLYHWVVFRRILKLPLRLPWVSLGKVLANLVPPVLIGLWLRRELHSFWLVIVGLAVVEAAYLGCGLVNRIFDEREKALLSRTMGRWSRVL